MADQKHQKNLKDPSENPSQTNQTDQANSSEPPDQADQAIQKNKNDKTPEAPSILAIRRSILHRYWMLCYIFSLINTLGYFSGVRVVGLGSSLYVISVFLTYNLMYILPAMVLTGILHHTLGWFLRKAPPESRAVRISSGTVYAFALLAVVLIQILIFADRTIFQMFGMHFNGFIWNLITTKGGIESMGGGENADLVYALIGAGFVVVHIAMLVVAMRLNLWKKVCAGLGAKWPKRVIIILMVMAAVGERVAYGISKIRSESSILISARAFPLYQPVTFRKIARNLGFDISRSENFRVRLDITGLNYPLKPLVRKTPQKQHNVVWLVAESLRADMLTPEIMPATWAFSNKAHRFNKHYSGGNGTRMGMFSMFYGIYGNYWFAFMEERRGPILMDTLIEQDYQFELFTSARFSYPEFDKTIFSRSPREHLHETMGGPGWEVDQKHIAKMLEFLDKRDKSKPFMTFEFFESPHARYFFPPESIIRKPFLEDFNYATANIERDIELIFNRYINSCHHLDSQIARVLEYLESEELLDSTIVIITGDHGEEFMEKGRWGHNSEFTEEQIRVPMVLYIPGSGVSVVERMTSHLDIPSTLLPYFGVSNDPQDYCLGTSMLKDNGRSYTVVSDWSRIGYVDSKYKASFPIGVGGLSQNHVTNAQDVEIEDTSVFYASYAKQLKKLLQDMAKFSR
jgi:membrane-anchored protein YejM (alkaline phosphatase superfamily)